MGGTGNVPHCAALSSFVATMGKFPVLQLEGPPSGRFHKPLNKKNKIPKFEDNCLPSNNYENDPKCLIKGTMKLLNFLLPNLYEYVI